MRLRHVLAEDVTAALLQLLRLADHADAPPAGRRCWLHDIQVLELSSFPVNSPPLVIFREDVGLRTNIKGLPMQAPHALDVPPHVVLAAEGPRPGEVVDPLELVHVLDAVGSDHPCPENVPLLTG